ncbi:RNA binding protein [Thelonectria olida]|uniref:Peptidyl-prolyl cis-trans isomerase n=1 Tax=Thelonectria olida TaxID=1576542 RepID=A0A9P8WCW4_9HYPO|nr:RNA binding protein [Thelonectria olida]
MSVLLETTAGDIVIDLLVDHAPKLCENFLKLCKVKYYNFSPVHSVQKDFSFQTGDPLGPLSSDSDGGSSIWGHVSGDSSQRNFPALFHPKLKHLERGTVSMATVPLPSDPDVKMAGSQFIITLGEDTDFLDGKAAIFGKVVEGFDALEKINEAIVDDKGYPLIDIRIKHTVILDDPYPDPPGLREPSSSPPPTDQQLKTNILFVCKLNPVTGDDDLELIFGRFGKILSCEVIRDQKTGDSLQYAFIEYDDKASCEAAYFKMQGVLIDDRRIHVDFSQSVSKLSDVWRNDSNNKRRANAGRGGWGGVKALEKRRQYRDEGERSTGDRYGMVYGEEEMKGRLERTGNERQDDDEPKPRQPDRSERQRSRSGSPPRRRDGNRDRYHKPRDERRGDRRDWDRRDRDRDRDGDRNRRDGSDRERDRDRNRDRHGRDDYRRSRR